MSVSVNDVSKAVILAGEAGGIDPILDAYGVGHKALITIKGETLIARVARSLAEAGFDGRIVIAANEELHGALKDALGETEATFTTVGQSPSATLVSLADRWRHENGLLITSCDHAGLSPSIIHSFLEEVDADRDIAAGVVEAETFRAAFPELRRMFIRLQDMRFTGANLFWIHPARAEPLFTFWRELEQNRQNPFQMARAIGLSTAFAYLRGALTRFALMERVESETGVRGDLISLNDARAAIDIDNPADLETARTFL